MYIYTRSPHYSLPFFFLYVTYSTHLYTLSLHDALPIYWLRPDKAKVIFLPAQFNWNGQPVDVAVPVRDRSEEHTSELQSLTNLVCRLLLEKKKERISRNKKTFYRCAHALVNIYIP